MIQYQNAKVLGLAEILMPLNNTPRTPGPGDQPAASGARYAGNPWMNSAPALIS